MINGKAFDEHVPLAQVKQGSWEAWEIKNGGGGWVHPMHIHEEEHLVVMRNGKLLSVGADGTPTAPPDPTGHPDDLSREDVVALDPGESVVFLRRFRTFAGLTKTGTSFLTGRPVARYVAHCHNLAHEDHAMMFAWEIVP